MEMTGSTEHNDLLLDTSHDAIEVEAIDAPNMHIHELIVHADWLGVLAALGFERKGRGIVVVPDWSFRSTGRLSIIPAQYRTPNEVSRILDNYGTDGRIFLNKIRGIIDSYTPKEKFLTLVISADEGLYAYEFEHGQICYKRMNWN